MMLDAVDSAGLSLVLVVEKKLCRLCDGGNVVVVVVVGGGT